MTDDARKAILKRRATFVAAALAGIACGKTSSTENPPTVCLSVPIMPVDASAVTTPPPPTDAGSPTSEEDAGQAAINAPIPAPSLSAVPSRDAGKPPQKKRGPAPCLLMSPVIDDDDESRGKIE